MKRPLPVLFSLLLLLSCKDKEPGYPEGRDSVDSAAAVNEQRKETNAPPSTDGAAGIALRAMESGMMAMAISREAMAKTGDAELKKLAVTITSDQQHFLQEVKVLAGRHRIALPDTLGHDDQLMIASLRQEKGRAFDSSCAAVLAKTYERSVKQFQMATDKAGDPELEAFAARALPALTRHRDAAVKISKRLGTK